MGVLLPAPVPHLDRVFDYSVPEQMRDRVELGCRVRVRFAGRLVTGFVVARPTRSDFQLQPIKDVKGPAVLPALTAELTREVARRYIGNWSDVVAAAVPPRHARVETALLDADGQLPPPRPVARVQQRAEAWIPPGPRTAVAVPWGWQWTTALVDAAAHTLAAGKRVLVIVPDDRDADAAQAALSQLTPAVARLTAGVGPQARYRAYLQALSGQVDVVVGTRAAAFVPMPDLGLIWLWQDVDPTLIDPQSPYWHAREVIGLRSHREQVPVVFAGLTRTPEVQRLVEMGWVQEGSPDRPTWRASAPLVRVPGVEDQSRDSSALFARVPHLAFQVAREGLTRGPVLVQVARRGYLPLVACRTCRGLAVCGVCQAPLSLPPRGQPRCDRCATTQVFVCPECRGTQLRALRVGSGRTAEEFARAFPGVPLLRSDAEVGVLDDVPDEPALVVCTPGAEPHAADGFAAAVLLDGDLMVRAPRLRAPEEALARWAEALTRLRPEASAVLVASASHPAVQALVRADPVGFAVRELGYRREAGLPPAVRMIALTGGESGDVAEQVCAALPEVVALGPLAHHDEIRWLLRCDYAQGTAITAVLDDIRRRRSEARADVVSIRVDPWELG